MKNNISIQMTWQCDIGCKHCCQSSKNEYLKTKEIKRILKGVKKTKETKVIHLTGGEPFVDFERLVSISKIIKKYKFEFAVITNANWCNSKHKATKWLSALKRNNLRRITISYDSFHAKFVRLRKIKYIIKSANELGLPVTVYASYTSETREESDLLLEPLIDMQVNIEKRWAISVGGAKVNNLGTKALKYSQISNFCPIPNLLTIFPTGECFPCCSAGTHPDLTIGSIHATKIRKMIKARKNEPYMKILQNEGPKGIIERLPLKIKEKLKNRRYGNTCHMCYEILTLCKARNIINKKSIEEYDVVAHILG